MRRERKKRKGIKIEHNKKLFWVIIVLIVVLIIVIYLIVQKSKVDKVVLEECKIDEDCVPATCCHPDSCISVENAPVCEDIMCSMVCSGPLDCGEGYCGCIRGKCNILKKE